jgi:hypothetical protein
LKQLLTISLFFCLTAKGQVAPPSLRCLEVLTNGDVKLSWLAPADPSNDFFSYEIYNSIAATGPYSLIGVVGFLAQTSYTHNGAGANTQSKYYYVRTKFGSGGVNNSAPSDTLRSIFLNVVQSTPDIKLNYNNLRIPKLVSSALQFSISKEYPSGTWSTLGNSANLNYADTISVCSASLNYRISLADNSGCVSLSNIQGGVYSDSKAPNEPFIDSISVLPNGQTVLAWRIPRDLDITKYRIYFKNPGNIYAEIDTVIGRNNTLYTYTTTSANNQAVSVLVAAIDSCSQIGSFDIKPSTIYLQNKYDICRHATQLNWTAYNGMPKGILEYRIYYSVNGSAFSVVGATTGTSFVHQNVAPSQNICYFIRVFNTDKSITSSSNRSCFFSTETQAPTFVYIKTASIKDNNAAEINIHLDLSKSSQGIDLLRSVDGVNFSRLAFLPYNGTATYGYIDQSVDPNTYSYTYQAIVKDSCGNQRTKSNIGKTILLKVREDKENIFSKQLSWSDYASFGGNVSGYNIYRIVNDNGGLVPIASTGPVETSYIDHLEDEAPNGSNIKYYVEAIEGISNPFGFQERSLSNVVPIYMEAKIFVPTAFAPRGENRIWLPVTHFADKSEYKVRVFNRWGAVVFETNSDREGWDGKDAQPGVYVYLISYVNSRGEYKEQKGTFLLLQ